MAHMQGQFTMCVGVLCIDIADWL